MKVDLIDQPCPKQNWAVIYTQPLLEHSYYDERYQVAIDIAIVRRKIPRSIPSERTKIDAMRDEK